MRARCVAVGILIALCFASPLSPSGPGAPKPATLLPALVWNPLGFPSGDSLYQSLLQAGYGATMASDLAPFVDSLSGYHLFIIAGVYEHGEWPTLRYEQFRPFWQPILTFLEGGGSLYWEGALAYSNIDGYEDVDLFSYFLALPIWDDIPFSYLAGADGTPFAEIDSIGYIEGITDALDYFQQARAFLRAPQVQPGGYDTRGVAASVGQTHTILANFSWSRLNDAAVNTRFDLIQIIMNWLSSGTTSATEPEPLPTEFALSQNYPNPFNAQTTIEYALPRAGPVKLQVYDICGRAVAALMDGEMPAGYHSITWNAKDIPSGLYFMRLQAGEFVETRKATLLK